MFGEIRVGKTYEIVPNIDGRKQTSYFKKAVRSSRRIAKNLHTRSTKRGCTALISRFRSRADIIGTYSKFCLARNGGKRCSRIAIAGDSSGFPFNETTSPPRRLRRRNCWARWSSSTVAASKRTIYSKTGAISIRIKVSNDFFFYQIESKIKTRIIETFHRRTDRNFIGERNVDFIRCLSFPQNRTDPEIRLYYCTRNDSHNVAGTRLFRTWSRNRRAIHESINANNWTGGGAK